jgi:hypothetical protein
MKTTVKIKRRKGTFTLNFDSFAEAECYATSVVGMIRLDYLPALHRIVVVCR